jgi:hypothetical protein
VGVARGNGDGTFEEPYDIPDFGGAEALAVTDFDGDGKDDLAVVTSKNQFAVYLGQSDGTLVLAASASFTGWTDAIHAGGDVNGDGAPDLVLNDGESEVVTVLLQDP